MPNMTLLLWLEQFDLVKHEVKLPVIWHSLFLIIAPGIWLEICYSYTTQIHSNYKACIVFIGCTVLEIVISFSICWDMYLLGMLMM